MATEASMLFAKMEEKIYYHTTIIISKSVLYESPTVFNHISSICQCEVITVNK